MPFTRRSFFEMTGMLTRLTTAVLCLGAALTVSLAAPIHRAKNELIERFVRTVPGIAVGHLVRTEIPAVPCPAGGQAGREAPPRLPISIRLSLPPGLGRTIAYYQSPWGNGLLGPKGWTCIESGGSSNSTFYIAPPGTTFQSLDTYRGPIVVRQTLYGGTSGRFDVARVSARVFALVNDFVDRVEAERREEGESVSEPKDPWPSDTLHYLSPSALAFRTEPNTEGLGTLNMPQSGLPVSGIAFLSGDTDAPDLTVLAVRLPPAEMPLYSAIAIYALGQ